MNAATASEIARLKTLTITQIVRQFESLFGEKCRSRNKRYLIRRIAWRLQANAEGDLSERARARAAELALDSEVRVTAPRETSQPRLVTSDVQSRPALDQRLPPPGSMLHREYKGRQIRVLIVSNGFEYEGQLFKSLTAVANAITGSHVNGFQFFGLGRRRKALGRRSESCFIPKAPHQPIQNLGRFGRLVCKLIKHVWLSVPKPLSDRELILHFLGRTVTHVEKPQVLRKAVSCGTFHNIRCDGNCRTTQLGC